MDHLRLSLPHAVRQHAAPQSPPLLLHLIPQQISQVDGALPASSNLDFCLLARLMEEHNAVFQIPIYLLCNANPVPPSTDFSDRSFVRKGYPPTSLCLALIGIRKEEPGYLFVTCKQQQDLAISSFLAIQMITDQVPCSMPCFAFFINQKCS